MTHILRTCNVWRNAAGCPSALTFLSHQRYPVVGGWAGVQGSVRLVRMNRVHFRESFRESDGEIVIQSVTFCRLYRNRPSLDA